MHVLRTVTDETGAGLPLRQLLWVYACTCVQQVVAEWRMVKPTGSVTDEVEEWKERNTFAYRETLLLFGWVEPKGAFS